MPSLSRAISLSLIAAASFIIASDYGPKLPLWVKFILVAVGFVTTAGALIESINWITYVAIQRGQELRHMWTISEVTEVLRLMSGLSDEAQVELAFHFDSLGVQYRGLAHDTGPLFHFHVNGHWVDTAFILEFLTRSDERYLVPVRSWSEGTHERMWAEALTSWFIRRQYAYPAAGNHSAAWKWYAQGKASMRARALVAFGFVESEE